MSFLDFVYEDLKPVNEVASTDPSKQLRDLGFKISTVNPTSFGQEFILLKKVSSEDKEKLRVLGFEITGPKSVFIKF